MIVKLHKISIAERKLEFCNSANSKNPFMKYLWTEFPIKD